MLFFFFHFHIISLSTESLTFSCRCTAVRMFALSAWADACLYVHPDPESIFACANRCFASLPRSRGQPPSPNPHLHLPLISFASSLLSQASVLRCHVGDTCVPVAALRNSGHLTKWSPLQPDNARGPAAPNTCL